MAKYGDDDYDLGAHLDSLETRLDAKQGVAPAPDLKLAERVTTLEKKISAVDSALSK